MPGAPNRPPEIPSQEPVPATQNAEPARRVLRRLAPSRVALRLDVWKGAPHADLMTPFERAETLFLQGDYPGADGALDQLSTRFAEPRWPTMPPPFRDLRAEVRAPQPPQWDPEFSLPPAEREARRTKRQAERQVALARGSLAWGQGHSIPVEDLGEPLTRAEAILAETVATPEFWNAIDSIWVALHERVPAPTRAVARPVPPPPPAAVRAEEA